MRPQQPEVAGPGLRLIWQRRQVIEVSKRWWALDAVEELLEVALVESEDVEIALLRPEPGEQRSQLVFFPLTPLGVVAQGALMGEPVRNLLD